MLGTKKLAPGEHEVQSRKRKLRERLRNLSPDWQVAGEVGWDADEEAEGLLKTRGREKVDVPSQFNGQPAWKEKLWNLRQDTNWIRGIGGKIKEQVAVKRGKNVMNLLGLRAGKEKSKARGENEEEEEQGAWRAPVWDFGRSQETRGFCTP